MTGKIKITQWPGYTEAKMTDKSAAEMFNQIDGTSPPRKKTIIPMAWIVGTILVYGGAFVFLAVSSVKILLAYN